MQIETILDNKYGWKDKSTNIQKIEHQQTKTGFKPMENKVGKQ